MELRPKRRKVQRKQDEENDVVPDRLSSLPNSIISHILSFLDTKTAIRTSVLSKSYELLWTLSQRLDFKLRVPPPRRTGANLPLAAPPVRSTVRSFMSHVVRVLQLRERSNLTSFALSMHETTTSDGFVEVCAYYAAKLNVQHLKIRIAITDGPLVLPKRLLSSSALISLDLHGALCNSIELPKSVSLPNLKELRLKKFEFCSNNFSGGIFSGCPNLEKLVLSKCCIKPGDELKIVDVNCPNLLRMEIGHWRSPWRCLDEQIINVNAPKLAVFTLIGHIVRVNFVESLSLLKEGNVLLAYPSFCASKNGMERKRKTAESCVDLLRQMCCAKVLSMSLKGAQIISTLPDLQLRADFIFENLRYIMITTAWNKHAKETMRIAGVDMQKKVAMGFLSSYIVKGREILPKDMRFKIPRKSSKSALVPIPPNVFQFLVESSPCAKLLILKLPKALFEWRTWDR